MGFPFYRWVDPAPAGEVRGHDGVPGPLRALLTARGYAEEAEVVAYLDPKLERLHDPLALPGMRAAAERIEAALDAGEAVTVFGDYDVDGVTGTALLVTVLRAFGARVTPFIPCRFREGYGFTPDALARCRAETEPSLIVTVDCGITAADTVARARAAGIDVVVTDHHKVPLKVPEAVAVVDPLLVPGGVGHELCGTGVVFKLCHALVKRARERGDAVRAGIDLRRWLDWVAVATVADMVPLTGESRILAAYGIRRLAQTEWPGLRALKQAAAVKDPPSSGQIAFALAPRINAAGRMESAATALELFFASEDGPAAEAARRLSEMNDSRRAVEDRICEEAIRQVETIYPDLAGAGGLACGSADWHPGVVGIVASRLVARFQRPVAVVSLGDGAPHGSVRSVEGLDIVRVLGELGPVLAGFGGHAMAAGFTLPGGGFDAFRQAFDVACRPHAHLWRDGRALELHGWIDGAEATLELAELLQRMEPFGTANPAPVWGIRNIELRGSPRVVGEKHLRFDVTTRNGTVGAIAFGMGNEQIPAGPLEIAGMVEVNEWNDRRSVQIRVRDVRPAAVQG